MVIYRDRLIFLLILFSGFFSGLFGGIKVGEVRIQFILSMFVIFVLTLCVVKWIKYKPPFFIYPVLSLMIIFLPTISNQFGFIQFFYMMMPIISFIVGSSFIFKENIYNSFEDYLKYLLILLCFLSFSSIFFAETRFDSRPLSIYISLIILICILFRVKWYLFFLCIFLIIFVMLSGARGALFSCLIAACIAFFFDKLKLRYAIFYSITLILFFIIFSENLFKYIFEIDFLRERTFYDGQYSYDKLMNFEFNSSGRDLTWPVYISHISERINHPLLFLFGEGYGSVYDFGVRNFGEKWQHPHNEIIRILFDFGFLGLLSFLIFWICLIVFILKQGDDFNIKLTVGLSSFTFLIMLTDNPLMYPLYYGNISLFLLGYSYSSIKRKVNKGVI